MYRLESSSRVEIADLGIVLQPFVPVRITAQHADGSLCLAELVRLGQVRAVWELREEREAPREAPPKEEPLPLPKNRRKAPPEEEKISLKLAQEIADRAARKAAWEVLSGWKIHFSEEVLKGILAEHETSLEPLMEEIRGLKKSSLTEANVERAALKALKKVATDSPKNES